MGRIGREGLRRRRGYLKGEVEVVCRNILYSCNLDTLLISTYVYNEAYLQQVKPCTKIGSMSCDCLNAALCNNECYTSPGLIYISHTIRPFLPTIFTTLVPYRLLKYQLCASPLTCNPYGVGTSANPGLATGCRT